ncbi:hypothetical protein ACQP3F_30210, partial [Escherichia coli]
MVGQTQFNESATFAAVEKSLVNLWMFLEAQMQTASFLTGQEHPHWSSWTFSTGVEETGPGTVQA